MKNKFLFLFLLLPILISAQTKKVLVIGIDGCRPDALAQANTPNIDNLISNGIFSPHALNDDITISGPGWSAILCGVWSSKHEVTGNDFSNNNYENYPPFFTRIEEYNSELHTVSFCQWGPINDFIVADQADFKLNMSSGQEVADQASSYLDNNNPDAFFLHFDDVDHAGHSYGFAPNVPEYITAIEEVDEDIGLVMNALQARPSYEDEDWLILVAPDHGGNGFSHGGTSIQEQEVFFIASGESVETAIFYKDSMMVADNPSNCLGDFEELRFDGENDYIQVAPNPIFDFGANQDFTIECRVRTTQAADVAIVGNKDWDSGVNKGFVFSFKFAAGPEWKVNIGDGTNRTDIDTGGEIADNEWHTLSVSFDRDGLMKMYQDGQFLSSEDISGIGDITTNEGLFFGADIFGSYAYQGAIAEVRAWNTVLADAEINDWACTSLDNSHPNWSDLLGYWKMDEGTGTTTVSDLANGNDGTINGAVWTTTDSILIYDYSNTPRLPDITATALTHLCIPISDDWNLDGNSWVTECMPTGLSNDLEESNIKLELIPNPANEIVHILLKGMSVEGDLEVEVYDSIGQRVKQKIIFNKETYLNIADLASGVYLVTIKGKGIDVSKKMFKN